ncbi:MAG: hypothetical protein ACOYN6_05945 [Ignavibacteria bacterium]
MKLLTFLNVIIVSILLFSFSEIKSQTADDMHCGSTIGSLSAPYDIPHLTTGRSEALRIAIIYVTFKDDYLTGFDYRIWDKPTNPPNPPVATQPNVSLIEPNKQPSNYPFMTKYADYTLSDFFSEMSMGKYDVVGDEFAVILPELSTTYRRNKTTVGQLNEIVLNEAKSQTNINYSNYNNWSKINNEWVYGNTSDGKAEMVIICYRNVPNNDYTWFFNDPTYGGLSGLLTGNVVIDNTEISSNCGIIVLNQVYNLAHSLQLMEHEFSHRFLDHNEVGFMPQGNTKTTYCYTPYERAAIADYLTFETIDQNGIYTRTLGDFIETGQTIKIQIPNTYNYYWVANYQKKSPYDGISRGGKNCYITNYTLQYPPCSEGKGLYVFREGSGCSNQNEPYDVISAEGKFNWTTSNNHDVPAQPNHLLPIGIVNMPVYDMLLSQSNTRYSGIDKYRKAPTGGYVQILNDDPCSNSNGYFIVWDDKGDGKNAFNMGYDEVFSPYSNPPTSECNPDNTGLTIKLLNQDPITGAIEIKIYYNNNTTAISELPPSKPKNLKVTADLVNTESFHPKLNWDPNIEPDFLNSQTPGH